METFDLQESFKILDIPYQLWCLMIIGQLVHIGMKVRDIESDAKIAIYIASTKNQISAAVCLIQSIGILWAGWMSYDQACLRHPDLDLDLWIGFIAMGIGYLGSSIWAWGTKQVQKKIEPSGQ